MTLSLVVAVSLLYVSQKWTLSHPSPQQPAPVRAAAGLDLQRGCPAAPGPLRCSCGATTVLLRRGSHGGRPPWEPLRSNTGSTPGPHRCSWRGPGSVRRLPFLVATTKSSPLGGLYLAPAGRSANPLQRPQNTLSDALARQVKELGATPGGGPIPPPPESSPSGQRSNPEPLALKALPNSALFRLHPAIGRLFLPRLNAVCADVH